MDSRISNSIRNLRRVLLSHVAVTKESTKMQHTICKTVDICSEKVFRLVHFIFLAKKFPQIIHDADLRILLASLTSTAYVCCLPD